MPIRISTLSIRLAELLLSRRINNLAFDQQVCPSDVVIQHPEMDSLNIIQRVQAVTGLIRKERYITGKKLLQYLFFFPIEL